MKKRPWTHSPSKQALKASREAQRPPSESKATPIRNGTDNSKRKPQLVECG